NNTIYYYGVKAKNSAGDYSALTNEESATPLYNGPVWWVATSAAGGNNSNDGSTSAPFATIDYGIQQANINDTVMVKAGTYSGAGNRAINSNGKNVVIISESGAGLTTLDAEDSFRHFIIVNGQDTTFQVSGFTLTNGRKNGAHGGSIFIVNEAFYGSGNNPSNAIFTDCIFIGNEVVGSWDQGGAVFIESSSPIFRNCTFDDNFSRYWGGAVAIGGEYQSPNPIFENCTFENNNTDPSGNDSRGGAIFIGKGSPQFTDCHIDSNSADYNSGSGSGGAVFIADFDNSFDTPVTFERTYFLNNSTVSAGWDAYGGALAIHARTNLINCVIAENYSESNNSFQGQGGGIFIGLASWYSNKVVKIVNCTITGNSVVANGTQSQGGGIALQDNAQDLIIFNTIVQDNGADDKPGIFRNGSSIRSDYNNLEDRALASWAGNHDIDVPANFTNAGNYNYSLTNGSFCIGAGIGSYESTSAPTDDILGNDRPGSGGGNPDVGAYENTLAVSPYPDQVVNLMGQAGHHQAVLTWDANNDADLNRYAVYQSVTQDFTPTSNDSVGEVATGTETFTAAGLTNGTTYFFKVTAIDNDGYEGTSSLEIAVIPKYIGPVWYVDDVGTNGEGSPTFPFNQIQAAIDSAATGTDTVMVLSGTYEGIGNYEIYLSAKDLIIVSEKGADSTILSSDNNHRHFGFDNGVSPNTKITGFTFKNGNQGNNDTYGGSIWINGASPQFFNCIFTQNEAENGGAVAVMWSGGLPGFYNCVFTDNVASNTNGEAYGGAVFIAGFNNVNNPIQFINCTFDGNAVEARNSAKGGAIYINSRVAFENCLIVNNKATAGYPNFWGETAYGGGLYIQIDINGSGEIVSLVNTTVANNSAMYGGGGESIGGGIYIDGWPNNQKLEMFNSIVWGNYATQSGLENIEDGGNSTTFRANYNIIENGDQFSWFYNYNENQLSDPQFVNAANGDYKLSDFSPAIGAGWTGWESYTAPSTDIEGNNRPDGAGAVYPDLGAFENPLGVSPYPRQVQNLMAEGSSYAVDLTWDENPDVNGNIDYYIVYMSETDDFVATANDSIEQIAVDTETYTATGLQNNTPYYFRIAAHNSAGYTGVSSEIASAQPGYSEPIWYVDAENGNNNSGDGSPELPFQSIGRAWGEGTANPNFADGDTIIVLPGTYDSVYDLDLTAPEMQFVLMSQKGPDSTFVDGQSQKRFINFVFLADTTTQIIGFTIQNCTPDGNGGAVKLWGGSDPKFLNCSFEGNAVYTNN
ncbi:MAG: fibronectin type III domain-containing protein, partial [Candidatus Marinimicrobia bacterium]|nr:fibronectin type III domain-containing protein [Candidatus Neomarinimicrobiota bacterium]